MQTSKGSSLGIILKVLFALAVFVILDVLITFARAPYGSKSQVAWSEYAREQKGDIDTLIVGSSTVMAGLDPAVLDEELGTYAYNLATPDQWLEESLVGIRTAYEDHGIKRVILGLTHAQVLREGTPNPSSAYMFRRGQVVSPRQNAEGICYLLFDAGAMGERESVTMLFPWVSNHVDNNVSATRKNLRMKLDGTTLLEAAEVSEKGWTYKGKGFGTYNGTLDYNTGSASYFAQDKRGDLGKTEENSGTINTQRAAVLRQICAYCDEHDIELIAVAAPMPAYNVIEYGDNYFAVGSRLKELMEAGGARYWDFNLARGELLQMDEELFRDTEHMNGQGAEAFTRALCRVIREADEGHDVDDLFYGQDEYLGSIDTISCVFCDASCEADGIHLTARAMTGSDVDVEYQFCEEIDGEWQAVRDWSTDARCVVVPDGGAHGMANLRVNARAVGSNAEFDRYRTLKAMY